MDRRNVFDLPPWTPRRAAHPRLRRAKRFRAHLRKKRNSQAARVGRLRRTLAPLSHRSQLVHVARRGTLRQDAQNHEEHESEEARQAREEIQQEVRCKEALHKEESVAREKAVVERSLQERSFAALRMTAPAAGARCAALLRRIPHGKK